MHDLAVPAPKLHTLRGAFFLHHELHIGECLASLCTEGAKMTIESKKHPDSQAFHNRETGRIDVAEVLILITP
jgi:hypothetical protein